MYVLVTLTGGLGASLGTSFNITTDVGIISESATLSELLAGKVIVVESTATLIIITSVGVCTNSMYLPIYELTTTTTSSTTTSVPTTTTTTTMYCSYNVTIDHIESFPSIIKYGLLYNWYAVTDPRYIANTGWHSATLQDYRDLLHYYFPSATGCFDNSLSPIIMENDISYWTDLSIGPTNESGFNSRGAGQRDYSTGAFSLLKTAGKYWTTMEHPGDSTKGLYISQQYNLLFAIYSAVAPEAACYTGSEKEYGLSVRLVKNNITTLSHGEIGSYIGNNGTRYRTICIGNKEWLADNLIETEYRNGDPIPEVTDGATWAGLSTGAICAYDNDWGNVTI